MVQAEVKISLVDFKCHGESSRPPEWRCVEAFTRAVFTASMGPGKGGRMIKTASEKQKTPP